MILLFFILTCLASSIHGVKIHEHMTKREIETTFNCDHKLVHEVDYEVASVSKLDHRGQRIRRSSSAVYFRAFDKNISLYLLENDNTLLGEDTPIFMARSTRQTRNSDGTPKIVYSKIKFPMPENLKFYHDRKKRAAITSYTDEENKVHMHGVIGEDSIIVKPIPSRLHKEISTKYPELYQSSFSYKSSNTFSNDPLFRDPFFDASLSDNFYEPIPHIIIKPKFGVNSAYYNSFGGSWKDLSGDEESEGNNLDNLFNIPKNPWKRPMGATPTRAPYNRRPAARRPLHPDSLTNRFPTRFPSKRVPVKQRPSNGRPSKQTPGKQFKPIANPDIVYPELLVSVDYETYEFHGHDIKELAKYMAAFWNAVDLRFRELSEPQVRLNIAGFIIPETSNSAPYYNAYRLRRPHSDTILASETLREVGQYFTKQDQFPKQMYDIAVAMTRSNLGSYLPNGTLETTTAGIAYKGGACKFERNSSAALVRDKGGFDGIVVAAHELAHSMGAPHDNYEGDYLPVAPCPWDAGYIMSYKSIDSRALHWSNCSIYAMHEFFRSEEGQCLRTTPPNVGTPYPKRLPGRLLSRDEQCKAYFGLDHPTASEEHKNNCAILYCQKKVYIPERRRYSISTVSDGTPPAEGSDCGDEAICLDGECVRVPKEL